MSSPSHGITSVLGNTSAVVGDGLGKRGDIRAKGPFRVLPREILCKIIRALLFPTAATVPLAEEDIAIVRCACNLSNDKGVQRMALGVFWLWRASQTCETQHNVTRNPKARRDVPHGSEAWRGVRRGDLAGLRRFALRGDLSDDECRGVLFFMTGLWHILVCTLSPDGDVLRRTTSPCEILYIAAIVGAKQSTLVHMLKDRERADSVIARGKLTNFADDPLAAALVAHLAGKGHIDAIVSLIKLAVDLAANNNAPLCLAAKNGHTAVVQLLLDLPLERGVDPAAKNNAPLYLASENGRTDVVQLLLNQPLERGVDPAASNNYALCLASENGRTDVVQLLLGQPLERGVDPAARNNSSLAWAAQNGHTDVVQLLLDQPLERGVDPAANNNFPLAWASQVGHTTIVQLLLGLPLERGVDPAVSNNSPLVWAAKNGHKDVVQLLLDLPLERGVDPAAEDNSPLLWATKNGHMDVVQILAERVARSDDEDGHKSKRRRVSDY